MKRIKLYAVEYYSNDSTTFEIFKTFKEAKKFADEMDDLSLYIFVANFDENSVYNEPEDGVLNYEDHAHLMENMKIIYCCICKSHQK